MLRTLRKADTVTRQFKDTIRQLRPGEAENRRFDRDRRTQRMRELYAQGLSTIEIGRRFGLHPSGVWRYINLGVNP